MEASKMTASIVKRTATPWGKVQHATELAAGLWFVSTASHGGMLLSDERVESLRARGVLDVFQPFTSSDRWWEEDCDWCIVALAFSEDIGNPAGAEAARRQLSGIAQSMPGKYQAVWDLLRGVKPPARKPSPVHCSYGDEEYGGAFDGFSVTSDADPGL
jgi:hypothetical protein